MAADGAQYAHHHQLNVAKAAAHNLLNYVDRTLRAGHSLREDSHSIAREAQQILQELEIKAQSYSGLPQAAAIEAASKIATALDGLRVKVAELQQQSQSGGLNIARLTRLPKERSFIQEARAQLQGAKSFIREEQQRAKEAATATTAPPPLPAAAKDPDAATPAQQQLAGMGSIAAAGATPFADIPRNLSSQLVTIALVPVVQSGGSTSINCVLWLCSNKKVEFLPSWAPTAGKTELALPGRAQAVTCVAADNQSGQIWTGHADGSVQLHLPDNWCCASWPVYGGAAPGSPVRSMALDCPSLHSRRRCWVGDESGSIRVATQTPGSRILDVLVADAPGAVAAAVLNRSSGAAAATAGAPVRALLGFEGVMFSAGGLWMHELCAWHARKFERLERHNCEAFGATTCLALLPWNSEGSVAEYSGVSSGSAATYDCWRLLSGHDKGLLLMWQMKQPTATLGSQVLQRLVVIGDEGPRSGIRGIAVVASLAMLVLAQDPCWLTVMPFPSATNGALPPDSAAASKPSSKAADAGSAVPGMALGVPASVLGAASASAGLMGAPHRWSPKVAKIRAHRSSLAAFASLGDLIVTASAAKSIKPWSVEQLRREAQGDGVIISRPSETLRPAASGSGSCSTSISRLSSPKSLALSSGSSLTSLAASASGPVPAAKQLSMEAPVAQQQQQQQHPQSPARWLQQRQQQNQQPQPALQDLARSTEQPYNTTLTLGQVTPLPHRQHYPAQQLSVAAQPQSMPLQSNVGQQLAPPPQQQQQQGLHLQQLTSAGSSQQQMLQQVSPRALTPELLLWQQQQQSRHLLQPQLISRDSHPAAAWRDPTPTAPQHQAKQQHLQQQDRGRSIGVQQHHIISMAELSVKRPIGMGAEGKVHCGTWMNIDVAVKEYLLLDDDPAGEAAAAAGSKQPTHEAQQRAADALRREAELLASLNHPNLVRFCGVCLDPPLLVMELYRHGNVYTMLHKARRQWLQTRPLPAPRLKQQQQASSRQSSKYVAYFSWDRRLEMLHNVAAGMVYLHKRCYVHGDLRSPNLFVGSDGQVKIGDFGFTKFLSSEGGRMQVKRITHPRWVAPELLLDGSLSAACDVYSFAMVMMEMLTWQKPFSAVDDEQQVVADVLNGQRPEIPAQSDVPQGPGSVCGLASYVRLMQQCWDQDPSQRPPFASIAARLKAMLHWRMIIRAQRLKSDPWMKLLRKAQTNEAARKQQLHAGAGFLQPARPAAGLQGAAAVAAAVNAVVAGRQAVRMAGIRNQDSITAAMAPGDFEQCPSQPASFSYSAGYQEQSHSSSSYSNFSSQGLPSLSAHMLPGHGMPGSFSRSSQPGSSSATDLPTPMPSGSRGPHTAANRYIISSSNSSMSSTSTIYGPSTGVSPWHNQQQQQQLAGGSDPATLSRLVAAAAAVATLPGAGGSRGVSMEPALSAVAESLPSASVARELGSAGSSFSAAGAAEHDRDEQARRDLQAFNQLDRLPRQRKHSSPIQQQQQQQTAADIGLAHEATAAAGVPHAGAAQEPAAAEPPCCADTAATDWLLAGLRPELQRLVIDGSDLVIKQELEQASVTAGNLLHGTVYKGTWCGIDIAAKQYMAPQDCGASSSSALMPDVCSRAKATLVQVLPVLSSLNHPNVVRLFGVCLQPPQDCHSPLPLVITEFYRHGSVWKMLQQAQQQYLSTSGGGSSPSSRAPQFQYTKYLSWQRRLDMLRDVAAGLIYLQKAGYHHPGLRSSRLYVSTAGRVKLGGLAALCRSDAAASTTTSSSASSPADSAVSQFGALMFEMLTWQPSCQASLQEVAAGKRELAIPSVSAAAAQQRVLQHSSGTSAAPDSQLVAPAGLASLAGNAAAAAGLPAYMQLLQECLRSTSANPAQQQLRFEEVADRLTAVLQAPDAAPAAAPGDASAAASSASAPAGTQASGSTKAMPLVEQPSITPPSAPGAAAGADGDADDMCCPPSSSAPEKSGSIAAASVDIRAAAALPENLNLELMPAVVLDSMSDAEISMPDTPTAPISCLLAVGLRPDVQPFADARLQLLDAPALAADSSVAVAGSFAPAVDINADDISVVDINADDINADDITTAQQSAKEGAATAAEAILQAAAAGDDARKGPQAAEAQAAPVPPAAEPMPPATGPCPEALAAPAAEPCLSAASVAPAAEPVPAAPVAPASPAGLPLLEFFEDVPAPADETAAAIERDLQQLELLRPQLGSQLLRLALLQTLFCATSASNTVKLYLQHSAQALQQQQQPGDLQCFSSTALRAEQESVSMQMQLLKRKLHQHHRRQGQHQQPGHSRSLVLLCLLVRMWQLQAALREWRHAAEQQLLDSRATHDQIGLNRILSSSRGSDSEGSSNVLSVAVVLVLGFGAVYGLLLPLVLQDAARSVALVVVALWLGWLLLSQAGVTVPSGGAAPVSTEPTRSAGSSHDSRNALPAAGTDATLDPAVQQQQQQGQGLAGLLVLPDMQDTRVADVQVAAQPCAVSSAVGRAAWPVLLGPAAVAAGSPAGDWQPQQQGLLHTLPENKYVSWWKLKATQQQQEPQQGPAAAAHGRAVHTALSQHTLLGSSVLRAAQQAADASFLSRLQQLLASQQQQLFVPVLWVCQEPPMLLEAAEPGSTLADWLQQQQQQQSVGSSSSSRSAAQWSAPFGARDWRQVLAWLLEVAAALAAMHEQQLVHGGVSAAAVQLVASPEQQQQQRACLSLAAPWQHAVTPGRLMDPAFAPPELQLSGASPTGSPAVDVYGFGLLMWQLATGWLPQQPQQGCVSDGGRDATARASAGVALYDELAWCGEMLRVYGTTFPGAASAAGWPRTVVAASGAVRTSSSGSGSSSSGRLRAESGADSTQEVEEVCEPLILSDAAFAARHGVLPAAQGGGPRGDEAAAAATAAAAAQAWLPAGYRQLMMDCCSNEPDSSRPGGRLDMQQMLGRLQQVAAAI